MSSAMCVCMCCCFPWKRGENKRNESNPNEASTQPLIMKLFGEGAMGPTHTLHMQTRLFLSFFLSLLLSLVSSIVAFSLVLWLVVGFVLFFFLRVIVCLFVLSYDHLL